MRSIEARFRIIKTRHPEWSSYISFADAIYGQNFCKDKISRHFNKLVEIGDYDRADKKVILSFLVSLSKSLRRTENGSKIAILPIDNTDGDTKTTYL
jgi:hypothetical protein